MARIQNSISVQRHWSEHVTVGEVWFAHIGATPTVSVIEVLRTWSNVVEIQDLQLQDIRLCRADQIQWIERIEKSDFFIKEGTE